MKTKYFKNFEITTELVSIEGLRIVAEMQARMDELVRYRPIQYLTDGYDFSIEEIGNAEISFSDITWGKGINMKHSILHLKDGRTLELPFGTHGLESLLTGSIEHLFTKIDRYTFLSISSIEKNSKKIVYLKGIDVPFSVSPNYYHLLVHDVYRYLTAKVTKWRVKDYVQWRMRN